MVNTRRARHARLGMPFAIFAIFAARDEQISFDNYLSSCSQAKPIRAGQPDPAAAPPERRNRVVTGLAALGARPAPAPRATASGHNCPVLK
jgi:hypothetical protein